MAVLCRRRGRSIGGRSCVPFSSVFRLENGGEDGGFVGFIAAGREEIFLRNHWDERKIRFLESRNDDLIRGGGRLRGNKRLYIHG